MSKKRVKIEDNATYFIYDTDDKLLTTTYDEEAEKDIINSYRYREDADNEAEKLAKSSPNTLFVVLRFERAFIAERPEPILKEVARLSVELMLRGDDNA